MPKTKEQLEQEAKDKAASDALTKMQSMIEKMPESIQAGFTKALSDVAAAQAAAAKAATSTNDDDPGDDEDDVDLEKMSRAELMKYMSSAIIKDVNKALKPVAQRLDEITSTTERSAVAAQVDKARAKYEDFDEWKAEINQLHKENPGLNVDRLYTLARAENPDKVAELTAKAKEQSEKSGGDKKPFLGLTPTSTNSADDNDDDGRMSPQDAATAAFDEAFKDIPEELFGT